MKNTYLSPQIIIENLSLKDVIAMSEIASGDGDRDYIDFSKI